MGREPRLGGGETGDAGGAGPGGGAGPCGAGRGSPRPGSLRPRGPGLLLLIALTGYTVKNAWKNDVFFSWPYFLGCLALPFSVLAGNLDSGKRVGENCPEGPLAPPRPAPATFPETHYDLLRVPQALRS